MLQRSNSAIFMGRAAPFYARARGITPKRSFLRFFAPPVVRPFRAVTNSPRNVLCRRRPGKSAAHRGGFVRNDGEQDARAAVGAAVTLFPGMYRGHVQAKGAREAALRQPQAMPELRNVNLIRHCHRVARQLDFAPRMRQRF